jgi:hypothetical protein
VNLLQVLPATTRKLKSNDAARVYSPLQKSSPQSVQDKTRSSTTPDLFLVFLICGSIANWRFSKARALFSSFFSSTNLNHASLKFPTSSITKIIFRILFFVRHYQNLRIFFCGILINVNLSKRNVKLILKILSDLKPLRVSSNKKTLYLTRSCVNWAFFGTYGALKRSFH